jgi:UDP-glucose 4-epimerase
MIDMRVLITGGTGSFGKTMLRHLLKDSAVAQIRILSRDEEKQDRLRRLMPADRVKFYIGDVRDYESVYPVIRGCDYVFHAAALKQVPSCEFFPMQAVKTNVEGSWNVIRACVEHAVKTVVCLSTDKAVFPVNAMGMSKALMEKVVQAAAREYAESETTICNVRYGNVMYSRGSVIPLFVEQIKSGVPLTLTVPEMTRFLMPLSQAVELVDFAFKNARPGDTFVRKAPAATIRVLAEAIVEMFDANNEFKVIGMRHGEKLFETLANAEELRRSEDMGDYYRVSMDTRDLDYSKFYTEGDPQEAETPDFHSHNATQLDVEGVKNLLQQVPEYMQELAAWRNHSQ